MSQPEQRQYGTAETGGSCGIQRRMSRDPYGRPAAAGWNAATGYGTERTARRESSDRWRADPPANGAGSAGRLYCRKSFTNDAVSGYELFAESHVLPASADRQLVSPAEHYRSLRRELTPELGAVFDKDIRDLNTQEKYALIFRRVLLQQPRVVFFEQPFWGNDVLLQQHIERQVQLLLAKKIAVVVLIVGIYDAFPLAERTLIYKNGHLLTQ